MKYVSLDRIGRAELMNRLLSMPEFLGAVFDGLSREQASVQPAAGDFSPVEHCWHLADLEREGYGVRISRLLREDGPVLPDFDGGKIAIDRRYRERSLEEGIAAFRAARLANLAALAGLTTDEWMRSGAQEGVGKVALCDIPQMMAEHDQGHRAEIEALTKRW